MIVGLIAVIVGAFMAQLHYHRMVQDLSLWGIEDRDNPQGHLLFIGAYCMLVLWGTYQVLVIGI